VVVEQLDIAEVSNDSPALKRRTAAVATAATVPVVDIGKELELERKCLEPMLVVGAVDVPVLELCAANTCC
jgi:hypothetical protein